MTPSTLLSRFAARIRSSTSASSPKFCRLSDAPFSDATLSCSASSHVFQISKLIPTATHALRVHSAYAMDGGLGLARMPTSFGIARPASERCLMSDSITSWNGFAIAAACRSLPGYSGLLVAITLVARTLGRRRMARLYFFLHVIMESGLPNNLVYNLAPYTTSGSRRQGLRP